MAGLEEIDVEQLLHRAYYERQVHRLGPTGGSARQERALSRLIALKAPAGAGGGWQGAADKVDGSGYAANMAAKEGRLMRELQLAPADELQAVHDAVLDLPDFYAELTGGLDYQVWDVASAIALGQRIDVEDRETPTIVVVRRRGGVRSGADDLLPNGPRRPVTRIVTASLMVLHGANLSRPDLGEAVQTGTRPIYANDRREKVVGQEPVFEPSLLSVALDRAVYAAWHCALELLAAKFAGLSGMTVTGPRAPGAPWEAPPTFLDSLLPPELPGHDGLQHVRDWPAPVRPPKPPKPRKPGKAVEAS